jgi:NAD+ synthase (glutamine-hydrolysing)
VEASRAALDAPAERLADAGCGELPVVVGYLDRSDARPRYGQSAGAPQNAAAVLHRGEAVLRLAKHHLQNYGGVFEEVRYFVPGDTLPVPRVHGVDVALASARTCGRTAAGWRPPGPSGQVCCSQ